MPFSDKLFVVSRVASRAQREAGGIRAKRKECLEFDGLVGNFFWTGSVKSREADVSYWHSVST